MSNDNGDNGLGPEEYLGSTILENELDGFARDIQRGGSFAVDGAKLGVLQKAITQVKEDVDYRQILLLANFRDNQEALLAADAIAERQRYGVPIKPILDRLIAQGAISGERLYAVLNASSRHDVNVNAGRGGGWSSRLPWKKKERSGLS